MRRLFLVAAILLAATACATPDAPAPVDVDGRSDDLARLNDAVADVAARQEQADGRLADNLAALRRFDGLIERLRDPDHVDEAKDRWDTVATVLEDVDGAEVSAAYRDVAAAVDRARGILAAARQDATGSWELDYLAAQDRVLVAVREHAEAADALAQVIERNGDVYGDLRAITATFVEQRWFYRTPQEAADAYELEIAPHLRDLRTARTLVARYTDARDEAALVVNDATGEAATVWSARPADASADATRP